MRNSNHLELVVMDIPGSILDRIIASKEENTEKLISEIEGDFPVYVSDIKDLNDALYFIRYMS